MEIALLVGRILFGGFFVMNGLNHFARGRMLRDYAAMKKVPMPGIAVALTGLLLLFGGAGILAGAYMRWAVAALAVFLILVSFKMHDFWNISDPQMKMIETVNFTKNMALLGAALMTLAIPAPWPYGIGF